MLEKLRSTTTSLGMPVEYVWLDLLTIPQRGNQELLNQEIAKQATIFALAAHGFVWLNDVESWDRTEALLLWISVMIVKEIILSTKTETEVNIDPHLSFRWLIIQVINKNQPRLSTRNFHTGLQV
jgi:hypothetical protein